MSEKKEEPDSDTSPDLEITQAAKELQRDMTQRAATLAPIVQAAIERQSLMRSLLGVGSNLSVMKNIVDASNFKVIRDFIDAVPTSKAIQAAQLGFTIPAQSYKPQPLPPSPAVETVSALYAVRKELAGMATQSAAQIELTTATLGALRDMLDELKRSRGTNRSLVRLTIGLVVLTIGLLALAIPEVRDQVAPAWQWLTSRF
ncbi:MAG TPA: hypothetical protein VND96_17125 [Candidatus Micrarchaeaceae archaeon]|nr:hypothetical protein [Candidatus Micrarchaeaceae archaeon]